MGRLETPTFAQGSVVRLIKLSAEDISALRFLECMSVIGIRQHAQPILLL